MVHVIIAGVAWHGKRQDTITLPTYVSTEQLLWRCIVLDRTETRQKGKTALFVDTKGKLASQLSW